jgi:transposase
MRRQTSLRLRDVIHCLAMKNSSTQYVVGIDLGNLKHAVCVTERATGEIVYERNVTNHRESMRRLSKKFPDSLMVMEVGSHSPWISRFFDGLGHEVLIANPRKVRAIFQNDRKCDLYDARMLAKIARFDPSMLYPIEHQSEEAQRDLLQIKIRDSLVRRRVDIISTVRCTLKSLGIQLKSPRTECFAKQARKDLGGADGATLALIEPALATLDTVSEQIKVLDKDIEALAAARYPQVELLTEITGVGVLTALCFVLVVGDHERFAKPRDIGSYLGLVPKRDQSGEVDKELRISCKGDAYLRRLLVGCAQYILGPFGPECDLRTRGLALAGRGGKRAKKKAVVATARKLAVVMLSLLKSGENYEENRNSAA